MLKTLAPMALALGLMLPVDLAQARDMPPRRHPPGAHALPHHEAHLHPMQQLRRKHDLRRPWGGRPRRPMRSM